MSDPIFFAPLRTPVVDERTGLMSREWYLFFQAMYLRIGGALGSDDLQLVADVNDATDDGSDIRAVTADLECAVALTDEPPSTAAADLAELQALIASLGEDPIIGRFNAQQDGLVPASGGGTGAFLRPDGSWASILNAVAAALTLNSTTATNAALALFTLGGANKARVGAEGTAGATITGSSIGDLLLFSFSGISLSGNGGSLHMRIDNTGAISLPAVATTAVAPAAGGAGALPATPAGYMTLTIAGTPRKLAFY